MAVCCRSSQKSRMIRTMCQGEGNRTSTSKETISDQARDETEPHSPGLQTAFSRFEL
jgi:hypothetical protein